MTIEAVRKVTLYGLLEDKHAALEALQSLGLVHLRPLTAAAGDASGGPSADARRALKFLLEERRPRHQLHRVEHFDPHRVQDQALRLRERLIRLDEERDFLERRIAELRPWGDFLLPPEGELDGLRLWFYIVPHYQLHRIEGLAHPWQVVFRDNRFSYVVVLAEHEPESMPVPRTHTGALPLSRLEDRLEQVLVEREDILAERASLTRWLDLYVRELDRLEDQAALDHAAARTLDADPLFAVQGWIPADAVAELDRLAGEHGLARVVEPPAADEEPPTLLRAPGPAEGGADLVRFYMTPGYRLWDPSTVVFASFALFFAMILSDAGYALVFGIATLFFWKRMQRSETGRRLRGLMLALTGSALVWGVLSGGYFGVSPPPGSLLDAVHVIHIDDSRTMMRVAILIGITHIVIANLADARRRWLGIGRAAAVAPLGWVAVLAGGTLMWLGTEGVTDASMNVAGPAMMVAGALAILLFTRPRARWGGRLLGGVLALARVTSAFGDVLSYLRLFALGLASASLAIAFNDLAAQVADASPAFGTLGALLVLLLGHGLNFLLAVMSGFVHGLRLNFIEFFNWSVPEEGTPFRAFRKKENRPWTRSS